MRRAFTLAEVLAALALLAMVAIVIGQASFNVLNSVAMLRKDSMEDAYRDFMRIQVLQITDLGDLRAGIHVQSPTGTRIMLEGDAEATNVLDLFVLRVHSKDTGYQDVFYLQRPDWYGQLLVSANRDDLLRTRKDDLEDFRRNDYKSSREAK